MKIFNKVEGWTSKVNFVDENNALVGYDLESSCCECASWCIIRELPDDLKQITSNDTSQISDAELEDFVFDTEYFREEEDVRFDVDAMAIFRIVNKRWLRGDREAYLILRNQHNGYYAHGFEAKIGDDSWQGGAL